MADMALGHLRVLDLTHYIAGPYCTKLLADYGAEVIKVERPRSGDGARRLGPMRSDAAGLESSGLFFYLNNNKRGVTLELGSTGGQRILDALMASVDLVVASLSPSQLEGFGITREHLQRVNRRASLVTITNFGLTGPYRDYRADHLALCALGGWANYLGQADRPPVQAGAELALYSTGVQAAGAALAAHRYGRETGDGRHVDVSIMETVLQMLPASTLRYAMMNIVEVRGMYPFPSQGILQCADGYVGLNCLTSKHWEMMARWMGKEHWLEKPEYATSQGRWQHSPELRSEAESWCKQFTKDYLFHEGQTWQVAVGQVSTAEDILKSGQLNSRSYLVEAEHPHLGTLRLPGPPVRMQLTPWSMRHRAPRLGEDNVAIYCGDIGFSQQDLAVLTEDGVI